MCIRDSFNFAENFSLLPIHEFSFFLGLPRELSYVRDGVLNKGAIDFQIPVSNDLDALHFLWWNADFTSIVNYKIIVLIKDTEIMFQPSLNISHSGQVPKTPTYWRMSLPCNNLGTSWPMSASSFHFEPLWSSLEH